MEKINFKVVLSVYFLFLFFAKNESRLCLHDPRCYCTTETKDLKISCYNVVKVQPINDLLNNISDVYSLRIFGQYLDKLSKNCFEKHVIKVLEISSPLISMEDDALSHIEGLLIVNLNGTKLNTIPKAVALPKLTTLEMTHGSLVGIDEELNNMTIASNILFSYNQISYISETAFLHTERLKNLDLSHNLLKSLNASVFDHLHSLNKLDLSHNQLQTLNGIQNLSLESLNLYGNNLTEIGEVFQIPNIHMKWLDLVGNPNLNISGRDFTNSIPYLTTLRLNNNRFENLDPNLISNFPRLQKLYLNNNSLTTIPTDFFVNSESLTTLELGNNNIESMKNLFFSSISNSTLEMKTLKYLFLNGNGIHSIECDDSLKYVIHLDLSHNQISFIENGAFQNLIHMTMLNLSVNPITQIESDSFKNQHRLLSLHLSFSELKNFNHSLQNLNELSYLYAKSSSLESLEGELDGLEKLKYAYLNNNNLTSVSRAFRNLSHLSSLDLSKNSLTTLTIETFYNESFSLKKLWIEGNPWVCDCRLIWLLERLETEYLKLIDNPTCWAPLNLQGIALKELSQSSLEDWKQDCPEACYCKCIYSEESVFTQVNCSGKELLNLPRSFPENVEDIDLSVNRLTSFSNFRAIKYPSLHHLNLENNELNDLEFEITSSVVGLFLSQNNLSRIPFTAWNSTNLSQITLSKNPWICNCETWDFRQWLLLHNSSILDLKNVKCGDGGKFNNEVIITLNHGDLCPKDDVATTVIAAGLSVFILLTGIILYITRKLLVIIFFACGCKCLKPYEKQDYLFDAFVLYADEDDEFALGVIVEGLESDSYRLFVPSRQILLTSSPVDINSSIADCCKVIVLLTSNFLRNSQCMQLMRNAMACSIQNTTKRFIFITEDKLPLELPMDAVFNALVKKSLKLRWGEIFFWKKLKYFLPYQKKVISGAEETESLIQ